MRSVSEGIERLRLGRPNVPKIIPNKDCEDVSDTDDMDGSLSQIQHGLTVTAMGKMLDFRLV